MTTLSYFLVEDEAVVAVMIQEAAVVVVETQMKVEDPEDMIIAVRKITHLYTVGRIMENQNGLKL